MTDRPFVTILMPALNEELYVANAIASLTPCDDLDYEVIVIDGGSRDGTVSIVQQLSSRDPRIRLVNNERRLQSSAINLGARMADKRASIFVRADCHALYPAGFISKIVDGMAETGAQSIVVPMVADGEGFIQRAIAAAQNSVLGTGGSAHRSKGQSKFLDHGHHAGFQKDVFISLGGYDESFSHNEDAEYDYRLNKSGGRVWMRGDIPVVYYPRGSLASLARQYVNHGRGRARTVRKHAMPLKLRQMAPVISLLLNVVSIVLGLLVHPVFFAWIAFYVGVCLAFGVALAIKQREVGVVMSGLAAIVMHQSWAVGFLQGTFKSIRARSKPAPALVTAPAKVYPTQTKQV